MTQETESLLRKSLDDVDRIRKRQIGAFVTLFCALSALLIWLGRMSVNSATDMRTMLLWSVMTMIVAVIYGVLALALFINNCVSKKILKGIELLSKE